MQSIARQICQALKHLHGSGIVHRDIKPENLLVFNPEPMIVKMTDFGLSKMKGNESKLCMQTFCGTLLYCAPEVYPDYDEMRRKETRRRPIEK